MTRSLPQMTERTSVSCIALLLAPHHITSRALKVLRSGSYTASDTVIRSPIYLSTLSLAGLSLAVCVFILGCNRESDQRPDVELPHQKEGTTSSSARHAPSHTQRPTLPLGRVTAIYSRSGSLTLGHESGTLSAWRWSDAKQGAPTLNHEQTWFAHEGAVRMIQQAPQSSTVPAGSTHERARLLSVGAGGSWAIWSGERRVSPRLRAGDAHINRVISDRSDGWVIAGARGLVARWRGEEIWRGVGEHGRAAFDLGSLDARHVLSVGSDGAIRCWKLERGETCGAVRAHDGWAVALKPTKAARLLGEAWVSAGSDGVIKLWPSSSLRSLFAESLRDHAQDLSRPHAQAQAHARDITSLDVSGAYVLSGSELGSVTLLRVSESGSLDVVWRARSEALTPVLSVALDLERGRALVGGGSGERLIWSAPLEDPLKVQRHAKERTVELTPLR